MNIEIFSGKNIVNEYLMPLLLDESFYNNIHNFVVEYRGLTENLIENKIAA